MSALHWICWVACSVLGLRRRRPGLHCLRCGRLARASRRSSRFSGSMLCIPCTGVLENTPFSRLLYARHADDAVETPPRQPNRTRWKPSLEDDRRYKPLPGGTGMQNIMCRRSTRRRAQRRAPPRLLVSTTVRRAVPPSRQREKAVPQRKSDRHQQQKRQKHHAASRMVPWPDC